LDTRRWGWIPGGSLVFSPGMTVTRVPPYVPTLQGEPANRKGMISAPPVVPGGQEISLGSQNLGPTGGGVPSRRSGLIWVIPIWSETPCVRQGLPHGHIVLAVICWSPCAQRRCCPTGRCCLPTFSHFLIGHKTSLSRARLLSLSSLSLLSLSLSLSLSLDPEPSKERVGDWAGTGTVWSLLCVAETRATRPNGELGYSTRRHC